MTQDLDTLLTALYVKIDDSIRPPGGEAVHHCPRRRCGWPTRQASGTHVAAIVDDPAVFIERGLYCCAILTHDEGRFLSAILNSPALTTLARPLMSYGKDEQYIGKHLWDLPIPRYDAGNATHQRLAGLGRQQYELVARLRLDRGTNFVTLHRRIRAELARHSTAREVEAIVLKMLG